MSGQNESPSSQERVDAAEQSLVATVRRCIASAMPSTDPAHPSEEQLPSEATLATLRGCVGEYTRTARESGMLPEHVLIRLKGALRSVNPLPIDDSLMMRVIVAWSLSAYFEEEKNTR